MDVLLLLIHAEDVPVLATVAAGLAAAAAAVWAALRLTIRHLYVDLKADRERALAQSEERANAQLAGLERERDAFAAQASMLDERLRANTDELIACREARAAQQAEERALREKVEEHSAEARALRETVAAQSVEMRALRTVVETKLRVEQEPRRDAKGRFLPWGHDDDSPQ